jgi:undecaprenyl-diphosphatase
MTVVEAIALAVVEGLTEFLPVSSTGHMIIVSSWLGIAADPFVKTYTVAIQLGAIASVLILYWRRFFQSVNFYIKLFLAFIPAAIIGLELGDYIDQLLERVEVVAVMLILGGILFMFIDKLFKDGSEGQQEPSNFSALKIGFFQCIAMIPGVSRSAATIIGGLSQNLNKKSAAEFSFFLAVPTMFAATAYKLLKYYKAGNGFTGDEIFILTIGNTVAFLVALLSIKWLIYLVSQHGFKYFGYYRMALGAIILILIYSGASLSIF